MVITLLCMCALVLMLVIQFLGTEFYLRWYRSCPIKELDDSQLPPAAVVLSLRGADATLKDCLDSLSFLNYPEFTIHVVVDNENDPAKELVEQWAQAHPQTPLEVSVLREFSRKAYLKTSAIRQCLMGLPSTTRAAVMVDADTIVYPNWLRDIVSPMVHSQVGLVTGNRWYDPHHNSLGSQVRFIYNAWSVPAMYFMRATWGGSLGIRREVFDQSFFLNRMLDTSSEESAMQEGTRHAGLDLEIHPNIMMVQRDPIQLRDCFRFMRRQLIWTRLYHPQWLNVVAGVLAIYATSVFAVIWSLSRAWNGAWGEAGLLLGTVAGLSIGNLGLIARLHRSISDGIERVQGFRLQNLGWIAGLRILAAIPIALIVFTCAIVSASIARQVAWRGVYYRVMPPRRLELVEYRPFAPSFK